MRRVAAWGGMLLAALGSAVLLCFYSPVPGKKGNGPAPAAPSAVRTSPAEEKGRKRAEGKENGGGETAGEKRLSEKLRSGRVVVRHILVAYRGARDAGEKIRVDKEEAYNIACEIRDRCLERPEEFAALARKYSDDRATAENGGLIPPFDLREVEPAFRKAVAALEPGRVSPVVETVYGYHVLKREDVEEAVLQSILIPYAGALHAAPSVRRSKEEARRLAEDIRRRIVSGDAGFSEMARRYSRDPWAWNGGYMRGIVTRGKSIPFKEMENMAFALKEGEVSPVFESPLGFHVLKRHPVEARQACRVVVYFGRTKPEYEARKKIDRAYRALQKGIPFPEVVKVYSEEKDKEKTKGFTPLIYRGTWIFPLEEKLFSMKVGEVSRPLKLADAFVIIARVR